MLKWLGRACEAKRTRFSLATNASNSDYLVYLFRTRARAQNCMAECASLPQLSYEQIVRARVSTFMEGTR